jgi:transposase InsO family protein
MQIEILALRHQLAVLQRQKKRVSLRAADRLLWVLLSRIWKQWRSALVVVKPETVIAWHRKGFRLYWRWKSRAGKCGRPCVSRETREPIRLFVFVVVGHHRRHAIHFNVTTHPTAEWTARQIAEAFPWDSAPRYLLHDRDCIYGAAFHQRVGEMGILEVLSAPRSPWQNAYAERLIGSLRRECLDHIMIFNESSLKRILKTYFEYYEHSRTHLSLEKDAPSSRAVQPPELGRVIELPQVGGLHHRYERRAA